MQGKIAQPLPAYKAAFNNFNFLIFLTKTTNLLSCFADVFIEAASGLFIGVDGSYTAFNRPMVELEN